MRATWTFVAVLAAFAAVQAEFGVPALISTLPLTISPVPLTFSEDSSLVDLANAFLENFRTTMKNGRADFNIRVLDPAVVEKLPIDVKHGPFNARIIAIDSTIAGASDFKVTKISQGTESNKLAIDIEIPEIEINGQFDMQGRVKLGFISHKINDQGPLALNITGIKLSATVEVTTNDDGSYNVQDIKVDSWSVDSIKIQLDNLLGGGILGNLANKAFNNIFPRLVESDRPKINKWLETMLLNLFNKYLNGLSGKVSENIEQKIKEVSEIFREAMKNGRQEFNIPVMDPATFSQIPIHVTHMFLDAEIVASNVQGTGASEFQLSKVSQIVGTNKVTMDILIPTIDIACDYDLTSTFKLFFIKFNVNKAGPIKVSIGGLKVSATAEVIIDTDGGLTLSGVQIDSWAHDRLNIEEGNLIKGNFFEKAENAIINKLFPSLVVGPHIDEVRSWAVERAQSIIARFLDALSGRVVVANLDARAKTLLEDLKPVLKTGNDVYKMPVFDPATIEEVPVAYSNSLIDFNMVAKNVKVEGASDYTITEITQVQGTNMLDVKIAAGDIHANSDFELSAKVSIFSKITDKGSVLVNITGLKATASAKMAEDFNGALSIKGLEIVEWTYDKITADFKNLQNGGTIGRTVNMAINSVIPNIVSIAKDTLTAWSQETAKGVLDLYLSGVAAQSSPIPPVRITKLSTETIKMLADFAMGSEVAQAA